MLRLLSVTVQPRLRGELASLPRFASGVNGSTPLARGTHTGFTRPTRKFRFNPACAGNSAELPVTSLYMPVQPRLRGELDGPDDMSNFKLRFNPACAGNSQVYLFLRRVSTVQPRLRGELVETLRSLLGPVRFNPACAGNSSSCALPCVKISVQPRLRGELRNLGHHRHQNRGSTPLARGTLNVCILLISRRRFNPACAGNSFVKYAVTSLDSVQPRLRGELYTGFRGPTRKLGSTPLARGTPALAIPLFEFCRFNPACAGNSL